MLRTITEPVPCVAMQDALECLDIPATIFFSHTISPSLLRIVTNPVECQTLVDSITKHGMTTSEFFSSRVTPADLTRLMEQSKKRKKRDVEYTAIQDNSSDDGELHNGYIRKYLGAEVTDKNCIKIRLVDELLHKLATQEICRFIRSRDGNNCIWGFEALAVTNPLLFNTAFREMALAARPGKPHKRPTEMFSAIFRACGVTARRGFRGPKDTDPDKDDVMYSHYYDFAQDKSDHNKSRLEASGSTASARRIHLSAKSQITTETVFNTSATKV